MWPVVIETDPLKERYRFWEDLTKELTILEPSVELQRITNYMKTQVLGNKYLVLMLRVLKAIDMKNADLETWESCYLSIIDRGRNFIKQHIKEGCLVFPSHDPIIP